MAGGSGFGPHFVWARLALVAVLVPLVVTVPVQSVGATVNRTAPVAGIAATAPDPGVVGPTSDDAVGWPLSSPVRGGEDRRPVLARAGARPTADHARVSALDHELLARFE
ncbi:hypothetical protein [Gordonia sp. KTR9]|uniref:hypothetical protein n=1 Tax=Gordonia sp. KTR9 TaxID=337191 RepID=UPI0005C858C9|nr:hypothetical protein [Gordonia sp. KTR9]